MVESAESTVCLDRAADISMHWLPCDIQYTGEAPVSCYFMPQPVEGLEGQAEGNGASSQEAAFRGRQLRGVVMTLPRGFEGYVLRKPRTAVDAARAWQTDGSFKKLMYWNHDTPPSSSDHAQRSFEWLALSTAVHTTISVEQVDAKLVS